MTDRHSGLPDDDLFAKIDELYESLKGSRRPHVGIRYTKNDPLGRIERRVRERVRIKSRDILRAQHNRKLAAQRKKERGAPKPAQYFNKRWR